MFAGGTKRRRRRSLAGKKGALSTMFKKAADSNRQAAAAGGAKKKRPVDSVSAAVADADLDEMLGDTLGGAADDGLGGGAPSARKARRSRDRSGRRQATLGDSLLATPGKGVTFGEAHSGAARGTPSAAAASTPIKSSLAASGAGPSLSALKAKMTLAAADGATVVEAPSKARARRKAEAALQAAAAARAGSTAAGVDMSRSEQGEWFKMQASSATAGNGHDAATITDSSLPMYQIPNADGTAQRTCLRVFWLDAFEDARKNPGVVFLFGKVLMNPEQPTRSASYASVCIKVTGLERCVFVLPRTSQRDTGEPVTFTDVYGEVKEHVQRALPPGESGAFRVKKVSRNYAFDLEDVPREVTEYLKIKYPAAYPALPSNLSGRTFSRVFGANSSSLENFLLKRDLMGPCWLELRDVALRSSSVSWCQYEVEMADPKNVLRLDRALAGLREIQGVAGEALLDEPPSPPLTVASISLKTVVSPKTHTHEVVVASVVLHHDVGVDGPTETDGNVAHFTVITHPSGGAMPLEFRDTLAAEPQHVRDSLRAVPNERTLLSLLIARLTQLDPDALVGHNITGFDLDVLLHRMAAHKIPNWSRLGRLRRTAMPKASAGGNGKDKFVGNLTAGRLLCDTYVSARELVRETTYALTALSKSRLGQTRVDVDPLDVPQYYAAAGKDVIWLARHTQNDAWLALQLMFKLQILPLTKQLTNLSGNLWSRSLKGARAERIEYLLLHEFHRLKFIKPDKQYTYGKSSGEGEEGGAAGGATGVAARNATKKRGKPSYSGGLVLEPKKGLYDKYVLLLDFNSLYPSIIQEYNLCFTTVERAQPLAIQQLGEDEEDDDPTAALPPLPDATLPDGVLPRVIRTLVQRRRQVKNQMKSERNDVIRQQLDIRQLALKILANSMYGCLGFTHSRFFAKPIAALITHQGREILQNTVDLAEKELGLEVIYGDTDSIMIYTNSTDLAEVRGMGGKVKREVNKLYKKLEIEIDGVFAMMLLLKKKKYAALTVEGTDPATGAITFGKEMKGLDLVRRDWCVLSKKTGEQVLDIILTPGADKEVVVQSILELLGKLAADARAGDIGPEQWVITKGLNKSPHDYPDAKSQPHLQVALRLMRQGKSVNVGDHVPYVITKVATGEEAAAAEGATAPSTSSGKKGVSDRARHPDEVARSQGALQVDAEWYIANQILPPIARLCDPIEGLGAARLAEAMGVDPSRFASAVRYGSTRDDEGFTPKYVMDDAERFKDATPLLSMCTRCGVVAPFAGVVHPSSVSQANLGADGVAGIRCVQTGCGGMFTAAPTPVVQAWHARAAEVRKAGGTLEDVSALQLFVAVGSVLPRLAGLSSLPPGAPLTEVEMDAVQSGLSNAAVLSARRAIQTEAARWLTCDDSMCGLRTRAVNGAGAGGKCPRSRCKGHMLFEYASSTLHTQLEYLWSLFDENRARTKATAAITNDDASAMDLHPVPQLDGEARTIYAAVASELVRLIAASAFHYVQPRGVFGYLNKVNKARKAQAELHEAAASADGTVQLALLAAGGSLSGKQNTQPLLGMTDL